MIYNYFFWLKTYEDKRFYLLYKINVYAYKFTYRCTARRIMRCIVSLNKLRMKRASQDLS